MSRCRRKSTIPALPCVLVGALVAAACSDRDLAMDSAGAGDTTTTAGSASTSTSNGTADTTAVPSESTTADDTSDEPTGPSWCPPEQPDCVGVDVLIVVDNGDTMAQEQPHVAANFDRIVEGLEMLLDSGGSPVHPSVNLMVTTTDVGHPLCTGPGASPRRGAPVHDGCNSRIASFTHGDVNVESACTSVCPVDVVPTDPFVHFDAAGTNVPDGSPAQALSCIGPQGIDGCAYKSPLEAMLLALDPTACWNDPGRDGCADDPEWGQLEQPFLREGAVLVIVMITDGTECSVDADGGEAYFTEDDVYWEIDPDTSQLAATPAVCRNAGVSCDGPQVDGTFEGCMSIDNPVLYPVERYHDALQAIMAERDVMMLAALGVPSVTSHNPQPPFEPTAGGVVSLVERVWSESDLTVAELDAGVTVEHKVFEFGDTAPGCATDQGNALFPRRVYEVCAGLDIPDDPRTPDLYEFQPRCCIESICADDYSAAIQCLTPSVSGPPVPKG